jgi:hypothetical protein
MVFWESLKADLLGVVLVVGALLLLSVAAKLCIGLVARGARSKKAEEAPEAPAAQPAEAAPAVEYGQGSLKLIHVDEKTAALIMAIVSDETCIPLSELVFKSIRRVS